MKNNTKIWSIIGGCVCAAWVASVAGAAIETQHGPGNPINPTATQPRGDDPNAFDNPGKWPGDGGVRGHVDIPEIDREPPDDGEGGGDLTQPGGYGNMGGGVPGPADLLGFDVDPLPGVLEDGRFVDQPLTSFSGQYGWHVEFDGAYVGRAPIIPAPGATVLLVGAGVRRMPPKTLIRFE